jgi:hypothetical protein
MTDRSNDVEKLERISEQVADSVLELSDDAILAEIRDSGDDPQREAERIRLLIRQVLEKTEVVKGNERTANQHIGRPVR